MLDNKGKVVVLTGGTKGIGFEIAKKFINTGAQVFIGARKNTSNIEKLGKSAIYVKTDVRIYDQMENLFNTALNKSNKIDIYINNAGISIWKSINNADEKFWNKIIDTNLKGCFFGCKLASEKLQNGGVIVNIASLAGKRGSKNNSVYVASKFGVVGLTQSLAKELGDRNIRVNSVCPVYIKTEKLLSNLRGDHPEVGDKNPTNFLKDFANKNAALKRLPYAKEIADACLYLASDYSSAITGQNINVDCGVLPQ